MDTLFLTTMTTTTNSLLFFPRPISSRRRNHPLKLKIPAFAAKEDPKFDQWDLMELKFGKLLGEDPKLTLAKIKARKVDPDASYLDIEKQFKKNKGKIVQVEEVPFDVSEETKSSSSSSSTSLDGLNLARPVLKKGDKFQGDANVKPKMMSSTKNPSPSAKRAIHRSNKTSSVPNVILRKPTVVNEDDVEDLPSRLRMKPNLSLKLKTKEQFSDMTLLRRPEPASTVNAVDDDDDKTNQKEWQQEDDKYVDFTLLKKPAAFVQTQPDEQLSELQGMHPLEQSSASFVNESSERTFVESSDTFAAESALQEKPERLGLSTKEREETSPVDSDVYGDDVDINSLHLISPIGEHEDSDWTRAEDLVKSGGRADVEIISCSTRGFVVSFGSLIGFLPYRNLAAKWKFLAFESWLRRKGLDPSMYKQNLGIIGTYDRLKNTYTHDSSLDQESEQMIGKEILPDMKLDDLLRIYDLEKLKFLSSFVGQKINVNVIMADRKFRKLLFSVRPKEKEELVEKKRSLMAKLRVGDVVKCCIKKIAYFGVFVEVEGVPALIHQTEVSWDATMDPASYFKIGQVVEAKVHQLDFALDRIFLSLKEITPDPLIEALESVIGGHGPLDGRLEAAQADSEWDDVKSLIEELQQTEGIESVSKGRFFLSPGLAPTFQVYMTSMFDNQYKLLARSGNKVQEVIVKASLDKEEMKSTILSCTNRVK